MKADWAKELPVAQMGYNGAADYIKHSYHYCVSPEKEQCSPDLRVAACMRTVERMKKGGTITQVSIHKRVKG